MQASSGDIIKINADGTTAAIFTSISIKYIAIDTNNNIYAAASDNSIYRIATDGTAIPITSFADAIGGIAIDASGNIYASVYEPQIVAGVPLKRLYASNSLYITDALPLYAQLTKGIYRVSPDGTQALIAARIGAYEIGSITIDNNSNIYAMENTISGCSTIIKIDSTGAATTTAEDCNYTYAIQLYKGIGIDADGGIIILGGNGQRVLKARQGVISDYIQITGEEAVNIMVNVADLSLSLKVPVNIRATKYIYGTKAYSYDSTNRLTSVMRGVLEEDRFSYDSVGNRLTDIQRRSYTYNNGNELLSQNGTSFTFDANGNIVSKTDNCGTTTYSYDSENRLVGINGFTINCSPFTANYKYDPFGRRIEKSVTDTATGTVTVKRYVYDREDILFELDGNGNIVTEYVHGPGIDEPIAMIRGGQTYYYHTDALGSVIAITDRNRNVVQRYDYNSFGEITYQQDLNFKQPYTYTGREYDQESGLYYYRARYYDAKVGRFISEDPIGLAGGINFYSYVGNNPVNYIDPFGLQKRPPRKPIVPVIPIPPGQTYQICVHNAYGNYLLCTGEGALLCATGNDDCNQKLLQDLKACEGIKPGPIPKPPFDFNDLPLPGPI